MAGAAFLGKLGRAMYRGATSRAGATGIVAGAAALGFASKAAPAARDAAMDVAFGDPNADETFLGRKLTPGAVFDSMVPGENSGTNTLKMGALTTVGGAGIGGYLGSARGLRGGLKGGLIGAAAGAMVGRSYYSRSCWRIY